MAVINDFNADYPLDFYRFFKEIGCQYIQFAPIVERILSHEDGRHLASLAENKAGTLADFRSLRSNGATSFVLFSTNG